MDIRARCDFVSGARAAWRCGRCQAHYGERCIPDGHNPLWGRGPYCLLCHSELTATDDPAFAKPFWHVLPYLLLYPLHFNGLLLMLLGVSGAFLFGAGALGKIFALMFLLLGTKYFFATLAARAEGRRWPPGLLCLIKSDAHFLLLKSAFVYLLQLAVVLGLYYYFPDKFIAIKYRPVMVYSLVALLLFAFPAITMILAQEKSLRRAIDPFVIAGVIAGMGIYYGLLWVLLLMLGFAVGALMWWAPAMVQEPWQLPLMLGALSYGLLAGYGLLGYALYQFRAEVGLELEVQRARLDETEFLRAQGLGAVLVLQQHGDLERARESLRELLNQYPEDLELHRQYHQLLLAMALSGRNQAETRRAGGSKLDEAKALSAHTDFFLELLLLNNNKREAAKVLAATLEREPRYRPAKLATTLALEPHLGKCLTPRQRAGLLLNAHQHYRADAGIPAAYKCLSELFAGPLERPDKARQLEAFIKREYPNA